jgi:hypothetical protein
VEGACLALPDGVVSDQARAYESYQAQCDDGRNIYRHGDQPNQHDRRDWSPTLQLPSYAQPEGDLREEVQRDGTASPGAGTNSSDASTSARVCFDPRRTKRCGDHR